jgi:outer membrane receptor protein involved in Fe transport
VGAFALPVPAVQAQQPAATESVFVTGSRIVRQDYESNTPIVTLTGDQLKANADITLDTVLNTMPQVNPAGTTTSNNPPNNGQANVDLRGFGANRNLVLIDGRRPMVSSSSMAVDLNTIPLALIESIEVITGGAGAVYGADAIAGVVNVKLKRNFEGVSMTASAQNSTEFSDAKERTVSLVMGGNFAERSGNAVIGFEYAQRQGLVKSQREFAKTATATTTFWPLGSYRTSGNQPSQAAIDTLFGQASYGSTPAGTIPRSSFYSFNTDGSLFYPGVYNSPLDVANYRYTLGGAGGENSRFYPDFYSYNFDAVNLLTLPLERKSAMAKIDFKVANKVEVFSQFGFTQYTSATALAPSPVPTINVRNPVNASATQGSSALVEVGKTIANALVVPVTNPFIPADLRTLLNSRTGDNTSLVGSGATEPFQMRWRTLDVGLRQSAYENLVQQYMAGARGPFWSEDWKWEFYASQGRTKITQNQTGNIDTNNLLNALGAADGGASLCAGGINPFGRQSLSAECVAYLAKSAAIVTDFTQDVAQGFLSGTIAKLPAGPLTGVFGAESRNFKYVKDPGAAGGPISGLNVENPAGGKNSFKDFFAEANFPLVSGQPWMKSLDLHAAFRNSSQESVDTITHVSQPKSNSNAYSMDVSWAPDDTMRVRGGLQRSARAPNFGELFDGGANFPDFFDPCSKTSTARTTGANAAQLRTLCGAAGTADGGSGVSNLDTFVATPGTQASLGTEGNTKLKPEKGTSVTLGLVWQPARSSMFGGFRGSLDYYRLKVTDAIIVTDPNLYIADCYNYYGNNPTYNANHSSCVGIGRFGDIAEVLDPNTASGNFAGANNGTILTSGVDVGAAWGGRIGPGNLTVQGYMNYLIEWKLQQAVGPFIDYVGTVANFGAGLGQSFPKWKSTVTANYRWADFGFDVRMRYINDMKNHQSVVFTGEQSFTGVPAITYWDLGATWHFYKGASVRLGVNNVLDQKPPLYSPNVQSGTDPSTYDVIGRRWMAQVSAQF